MKLFVESEKLANLRKAELSEARMKKKKDEIAYLAYLRDEEEKARQRDLQAKQEKLQEMRKILDNADKAKILKKERKEQERLRDIAL